MPRTSQEEKTRRGMAGEFLVAAELNRRGFQAAVTFGSAKRADVYALDSESDRLARIEVKSTREGSRKWVLGQRVLDRKTWSENVFWVLVKLPDPHPPTADTTDEIRGRHAARFYVFTSKEIGEHVQGLHEEYVRRFRERNGREFEGPGVLQLPTSDAQESENRWDKLAAYLQLEG